MAKTKKISKVKGDIGRDHPGTTHEGNVKKKFKSNVATAHPTAAELRGIVIKDKFL